MAKNELPAVDAGLPSLRGQFVLVTGITGFIGSHLALRLTEQGARVRGLARSPAKGEWLARRGIELVAGDMTDAGSLRRAVAGCNTVFSVAAWGGPLGSIDAARRVNVDGVRNLARAAVEAGVQRFVHTSSIAAYGLPSAGVVDETWPLGATDAYGASKAEGETIVFGFSPQIDVSIVRPAQVYGPRGRTWTVAIFDAVKRGWPILIGGGYGTFHPCYIDNLIDAYVLAAIRPEAVGQAFTLVDATTNWREFVGYYGRMLGQPVRSVPVWPIVLGTRLANAAARLARRPSPVPRGAVAYVTGSCRFSNVKAKRLLGWQPRVSLDEGMRRTGGWLRETGRLA